MARSFGVLTVTVFCASVGVIAVLIWIPGDASTPLSAAAPAATSTAAPATTAAPMAATPATSKTPENNARDDSQSPELTDGRGNVLLAQGGAAGTWYCEDNGAVRSVIGEDSGIARETSARGTVARTFSRSYLADRTDEVIGAVYTRDSTLADRPFLDLSRTDTAALGLGGQPVAVAVLLQDPARPENQPAGYVKLRFTDEVGWVLDGWTMCSSALTGIYKPYVLSTDDEIAELERAHLKTLDDPSQS